jgi:hypothetical protein
MREALDHAVMAGELRYCDLNAARNLKEVASALATRLDAEPELAEPDAQILARLARRGRLLLILWDGAEEAAPERAAAHPEDDALVVHAEGRWFQLPSGRRVDCWRRHSLCRILLCLARGRLQSPRVPRTTTELLQAGWPEESILPAAALGRLRVAINTLRELGLRDHLFSHGGGYLLDASVPLRLEERPPALPEAAPAGVEPRHI